MTPEPRRTATTSNPRLVMNRWLLLPLLLLALPATAQQNAPREVEFIAHRGESIDAPENTMAAFLLAWERGVPTIELDVHLTSEGRLILSHDANTRRTTGVEMVIRESSVEELQRLDAGSWKGERWAGERMPLLEDVLAAVPEQGRVFIEIKEGPEAVPALVEAVRASGKRPDQLVVISFNAETIAETKRRLPELEAFYLSSFRRPEGSSEWTPGVDELIETAKRIGADGLNLSHAGPVDAEFARRVRDAGLGMYVWTVNDTDVARRMVRLGVDGITTDRPASLREELRAEHMVR
jgi:glycerophosphoryl diester phosphodiesterase